MFTITIEVSDDGRIWQAMAPPENIEADDAGDAARWVATNETEVTGETNWRVFVWEGADADTSNPDTATLTLWADEKGARQ